MAYSLHITRKFINDLSEDISISEWEEIVSKMVGIKMLTSCKAQSPTGELLEVAGEGTAVWTHRGKLLYLRHFSGRISVDNPSTYQIFQMQQLAYALKAEVRGDEGEIYERPDLIVKGN